MSRPDLYREAVQVLEMPTVSPPPSLAARLEAHFDFFVGVPDSEIREAVDDLIYQGRHRFCFCLPREDLAIACAAGHYLAGGSPLVFLGMQGLATTFDALTSLCVASRLPLVLLASWSANATTGLHHKRAIGAELPLILESIGVQVLHADEGDMEKLASRLVEGKARAQSTSGPAVVLLAGQHLRKDA